MAVEVEELIAEDTSTRTKGGIITALIALFSIEKKEDNLLVDEVNDLIKKSKSTVNELEGILSGAKPGTKLTEELEVEATESVEPTEPEKKQEQSKIMRNNGSQCRT